MSRRKRRCRAASRALVVARPLGRAGEVQAEVASSAAPSRRAEQRPTCSTARLSSAGLVRRAEAAPGDEIGARRDRGGRVDLQQGQPLHDRVQLGRPRRIEQLRAHRNAPSLFWSAGARTSGGLQCLDRRRRGHLDSARETRVESDERVRLELVERNVLGVEGLGPPQLLGDGPGLTPKHGVAEEVTGMAQMRASRSRATSEESAPSCTASCNADSVWERRSVGASSSCLPGPRFPRRQMKDGAAVDDESGHRNHATEHLRLVSVLAMATREAACHCGQLRLEVTGDPFAVSICHCLACQRRTGSAFGMQAEVRRNR